MPLNFNAAYALVFCAGVFPKRLPWWSPFGALVLSDIALNLHYGADMANAYTLFNYASYAMVYWLGRLFSSKQSLLALTCGGTLGALVFYFVSNTAAWLHNPFYAKTLWGWIQALTTGEIGWPQTWTFFRNTLLSGGLFTALFVGAMKWNESEEEAEEEAEAEAEEPAGEAEEGSADEHPQKA